MRDHPKWMSLSPLAYKLGVRMVLWATQHSRGTGFVPEFVAREYAGTKTMAKKLTDELRGCGVKFGRSGVLDSAEGGYVVHDLLTGDEPSSPVRSLTKSEAGRLGGQASVEARKAASGSASPKQNVSASDGASGSASASTGQAAPDLSFQDHSGSSSSGSESDPPLAPHGEPKPTSAAASLGVQSQRVFDFWREDTGHRAAIFDRKRRKRIEARLREGRTEAELKRAIRNRRLNRFLMGENDQGTVYDGIETLLRDAAQVEKLLSLAPDGASLPAATGAPPPADLAAAAKAKADAIETLMRTKHAAARGAS